MKIISKILFASSFLVLVACGDNTNNEVSDDNNLENTPAEVVDPNNSASQDQNQVNQNQTIQADPNSDVALNPPHGEPGHDCAIPVGAPLDGSGNSQQIQMNTDDNATQIQGQTHDGTVAEGLNPPHGEPGHDCAIPVGAPLNQ